MHTTWTGWKSDPMEVPRCPRCGSALTESTQICPSCNLRFSEISLYDPKHFVWLAMMFSFLVPSLLGAVNFGRLGRPGLKKAWLVGGIVGFAALVLFVTYIGQPILQEMNLADSDSRMAAKWAGYIINLPVASFLFFRQRALFRGALEIGMKKASLFKGTLAGIGLTLVVGIVAVFAWEVAAPPAEREALALMHEGKFQEAGEVLDGLLKQNPGDPQLVDDKAMCQMVVLMGDGRFADALEVIDRLLVRRPGDHGILVCKGSCHVALEQWEAAEQAFRRCLPIAEKDPEIYVFLGFSCEKQDRPEEAQQFYALADQAQPGLSAKLLRRD